MWAALSFHRFGWGLGIPVIDECFEPGSKDCKIERALGGGFWTKLVDIHSTEEKRRLRRRLNVSA